MEIINNGHTYKDLPNGFSFDVTPSHGYLIVCKELMKNIPVHLHETPFSRDGRYEEDVEWCIPIVFNLKLFRLDTQQKALECFKDWFKKDYYKYFYELNTAMN